MLQLRPIENKAGWNDFIDLPWEIYKGDPVWVPPLRIAVRDQLDVVKNPFFKHAAMHALVAYQNDKPVGRIVGVIDENHNRFHQEQTAFFGFFEAIDDQKVANALLDDVARWARARGMKTLRGPINLSTNHECGLLVDGFQNPPSIMMTYNPPYYSKLLESWGMTKAKDLYAWEIDGHSSRFAERMLAQAERLKSRGSVTFRTIDVSKFDEEIERVLEIYNDAWENNWGFVPMEPDEFRHMAKDMKMVLDPQLVLIGEVRGEPAAFALTLPDINQVLQKIPDGKLFPTGIFKLLWNYKGPGRKKAMNRCRILTLGIKKSYRSLGIGPLFYAEYFKRGPAHGYPIGEASWILEDNKPMNRALEMMDAKKTKTYRIFDRSL